MTTTITTYLGEQLSIEPDRLKLEIDSDGDIARAWVDGQEVTDDLLDLIGREEFDRVEQLAMDTFLGSLDAQDSPRDRAIDAYMAECKARAEDGR